jgi:hypothetical protein
MFFNRNIYNSKSHPVVISSLHYLGSHKLSSGDTHTAQLIFEECLKRLQKFYGDLDHPSIGTVYMSLALNAKQANDIGSWRHLLETGLSTFVRGLKRWESIEVVKCLCFLTCAVIAESDYKYARLHLERIAWVLERLNEREDSNMIQDELILNDAGVFASGNYDLESRNDRVSLLSRIKDSLLYDDNVRLSQLLDSLNFNPIKRTQSMVLLIFHFKKPN